MYIDIHTHRPVSAAGSLAIFNQMNSFLQPVSPEGSLFSAGVHPRYIVEADVEEDIKNIERLITHPGCVAIGECGLDRLSAIARALQETVFSRQILLAEKAGLPLIIHCVRSFNEVLAHLKSCSVPVIIHGVSNKWTAVRPFIEQGYYLSFGRALVNNNRSGIDTFLNTPLDQVFFETDDMEVGIEKVYETAAEYRDICVEDIKLQLQKNYFKVFKTPH